MRWAKSGGGLVDTYEMAEFFDRLDHLNQEQLLGMRAAWHSIGREAHEEAWAVVRNAGVREDLTDEIDAVRKKAIAWATRGSGLLPHNRRNGDVTWQQVKMEAAEAIVDAALAAALGGRLDDRSRDVLLGPWLRATEGME